MKSLFLLSLLLDVPPPQSVKVTYPTEASSSHTTPIIQIQGTQKGDWAKLYADSKCERELASKLTGRSVAYLQTPPLPVGKHVFYATIVREGVSSPCSEVFAEYEVLAPTITVPEAPSNLTLQNPVAEVGTNPNPTVRIEGVQKGDIVRLYSGQDCAREIGLTIAQSETVSIPIKVSLPLGKHLFFAKVNRKRVNSPCSKMGLAYTLIPEAPIAVAIQVPSTAESYNTTPVVRASGVRHWDVVKLYSDESCKIEVGSTVARDVTADIPVSYALTPGAYTFFAKIFRKRHPSACSQASSNYTVKSLPQKDLQNFDDPSPDFDRWGAYSQNRKWMRQIAQNYWSQLKVEVEGLPSAMIQSALEIRDRKEAAAALLLNEFGLVDSFVRGLSGEIVGQGEFNIDDEKGKLEVLKIGAYSAKIKFPIISRANWYRVEIVEGNMGGRKVLSVRLERPPLHRNHIEYLVAGLIPNQNYVAYVTVLSGQRLLAINLGTTESRFKTGGQCIPYHPGRGWNEEKYTPVPCPSI